MAQGTQGEMSDCRVCFGRPAKNDSEGRAGEGQIKHRSRRVQLR